MVCPAVFSLALYTPLLAILAVLLILFVIFKVFKVSVKILWKLLINGLVGAGLLFLFNLVLADLLSLEFFRIGISWLSALVAGILGIPGVLLMLILKFIL